MEIYTQLHSVLNIDNVKTLVELDQWAQKRLTGERLSQYLLDRDEFLVFYNTLMASGELTIGTITKQVTTSRGTTDLPIGSTYTWANQKQTHTKFDYWQQQFAADPVVVYQPEILKSIKYV